MNTKRLAALDIGTVRVGIAISSPETGLAIPHSTLYLKSTPDPFSQIASTLENLGISCVVVGWPLELDGSQGPAIRRTKQFILKLKAVAPHLRFAPQDERLTSAAAENTLQAMHTQGSRKKNVVDAMAAALILQTYLDRKSVF